MVRKSDPVSPRKRKVQVLSVRNIRKILRHSFRCGAVYELDSEIGKAIARGEEVEIQQNHLTRVMNGRGYTAADILEQCHKLEEDGISFYADGSARVDIEKNELLF